MIDEELEEYKRRYNHYVRKYETVRNSSKTRPQGIILDHIQEDIDRCLILMGKRELEIELETKEYEENRCLLDWIANL